MWIFSNWRWLFWLPLNILFQLLTHLTSPVKSLLLSFRQWLMAGMCFIYRCCPQCKPKWWVPQHRGVRCLILLTLYFVPEFHSLQSLPPLAFVIHKLFCQLLEHSGHWRLLTATTWISEKPGQGWSTFYLLFLAAHQGRMCRAMPAGFLVPSLVVSVPEGQMGAGVGEEMGCFS